MKNKKWVVSILILSLMLMGAGYAAWTQGFSVDATVNTGELKVVYLDDGLYYNDSTWVEEWPYQEAEYKIGENTFDVKITDLYPGIHVCINQAMKNVGTIPATIASVDLEFADDTDPGLYKEMIVQFDWYQVVDADGNVVEGNDWGEQFALTQLPQKLEDKLTGIVLEPGYTIELGDPTFTGEGEDLEKHFDLTLPMSTTNDTEGKSLGFEIKMNFKQFNK